jgi:hypothetical protein
MADRAEKDWQRLLVTTTLAKSERHKIKTIQYEKKYVSQLKSLRFEIFILTNGIHNV